MATRSNANANATAVNTNPAVSNDDYIDDTMAGNPEPSALVALKDDIDDIPDSLDDEGAIQRSVPATNAPSTTGGMGIDKLGALTFDEDRDEHTRKMLNPPAGDWVKSERWKMTEVVYSGDCMPGDVNSDGRTVLIFSGELEPRVVGDIEYSIKCSLRVSPDLRYKADKPSEVDMAHRLFIKAKDLYIALHDERPRSMAQLISMFEEDRYIVRTMNGDNGPLGLDIKDPKTVQRRSR